MARLFRPISALSMLIVTGALCLNGPAHAVITTPDIFGAWQLSCGLDLQTGKKSCSIELTSQYRLANKTSLGDTVFSFSATTGQRPYKLTTVGSSIATCQPLRLDETVIFTSSPRREVFFDQAVTELQDTVIETLQSHLKLIGRCRGPARQIAEGLDKQALMDTIPDLKRAIAAFAERERKANPYAWPQMSPTP